MGERIHHYRFHKLFPDDRVSSLVADGVDRASQIFEAAASLVKLFTLETYSQLSTQYGGFSAKTAYEFAKIIDLSPASKLFSTAFTVASADLSSKKGRPFSKTNTLPGLLDDCYARHASNKALPLPKINGANLSHVTTYMVNQLHTAYRNNIFLHYDAYVKRFVSLKMADTLVVISDRKQRRKLLNTVFRLLLYENDVDATQLREAVGEERGAEFLSLLPVRGKERYTDLRRRPEIYLPYMIYINTQLEEADFKFLNPSPTRQTFVPCHVMLDTSALVDLVIQPSGVPLSEVLLVLEDRMGIKFPPKMDKGQLYGDPCKIFPQTDRRKFPADFKSHIWATLSGMGANGVHSGFCGRVFNNAVTTNGYKADAHYVSQEAFYYDRFKGGKRPEKEEAEEDFLYVHRLPEEQRSKLLGQKRLYVDPGKGNILYLSDGVRKTEGGKRLLYTAAQRRFETSQKRNKVELEAMLDLASPEGGTYREAVQRLGDGLSSRKSSNIDHYQRYLILRLEASVVLRPFYQRTGHRRRQYRALLGRISSEDKLVGNITSAFGAESVIFWGNWGRNPNLKNQPPTPGIGLRRRIAKRFQTFTYDERMSSSLCYCCSSPVSHPKTKSFRRVNRSGLLIDVTVDIHHLLRCENENCNSRWWHRDNMGSLNGMKITEYALQHGKCHPDFTKPKSRVSSRKKRKQTSATPPTNPGSVVVPSDLQSGVTSSPDGFVA